MHGIHHSTFRNETDSNWSSLLSVWDYLHGTALLAVPQRQVQVGVPAFADPRTRTLARMVLLPFARRADDWTSPDGDHRFREPPAEGRGSLAA
jgi:sterol desaturase/sphingolipid hydroxylase (fatty acid hydroxylase superfamily)